MLNISYLDLDLRIGREQGRYSARVINSPAGQAVSLFDLPFSELELENFLLRMGRAPRGLRRMESSEVQAAKAFGGRLFETVFANEVRACLGRSLDEAARQGAGLRIRLRLSDVPELTNVPWEFTYDQSHNRFLTLSAQTPLVRYMDLADRIRPLAVKPPLRVLIMIASPSDYPSLNVEMEWAQLNEALADLQERGQLAVELLPEASLSALQRALRRTEYHIFHFVGHGAFNEGAQDGVLLMVDSAGRGRPVSGQYLGALLHDQRSLRLAMLNACEGARSAASDPFAGVAQSLVQQGLPAVIAMQFAISDQAAITLSHELYLALADGYPADAALAEARKAIYAQDNNIEWATPVLYLRAPDGRIFDIAQLTETERRRAKQITALIREAQEATTAGNWLAAESSWRAVMNLDPANVVAQSGYEEARQQRELVDLAVMVKTARERGDWATVAAKLKTMLQLNPGNSDAITQLEEAERHIKLAELIGSAKAAAAREDWDAAIAHWQGAQDLAPRDPQVTAELVAVQQQAELAGQYARALTEDRSQTSIGAEPASASVPAPVRARAGAMWPIVLGSAAVIVLLAAVVLPRLWSGRIGRLPTASPSVVATDAAVAAGLAEASATSTVLVKAGVTPTPTAPIGAGATAVRLTRTPTGTPTITPAPVAAFTVKSTGSINVRSGPGTIYPIIGSLKPGQVFEITGRNVERDWWRFDYNGRWGWVSDSSVTVSAQAAVVAVYAAPPTPTQNPTATATTDLANAASYSGQVRWNGKPLPGMEVRLTLTTHETCDMNGPRPMAEIVTDSQGYYRFDAIPAPGWIQIYVTSPDWLYAQSCLTRQVSPREQGRYDFDVSKLDLHVLSPAPNAAVGSAPVFSWEPYPGAAFYNVAWLNKNDPNLTFSNIETSDTSLSPPQPLAAGDYELDVTALTQQRAPIALGAVDFKVVR